MKGALPHMKILAVDFGDARTGLAVCDKVVALGSDGIVRTSKTDLKETVKTIFKDKQNDNQI